MLERALGYRYSKTTQNVYKLYSLIDKNDSLANGLKKGFELARII